MTTSDEREPIRVLVGAVPELLGLIIREVVAKQPDMEVVSESIAPVTPHGDRVAVHPDVIVVALPDAVVRGPCVTAAAEHHASVVGIASDGREAVVYYRNLSVEGLRKAIRSAVGAPGDS